MGAQHAPLADALAPLLASAKAAMDEFDAQVASLGPLQTVNAVQTVHSGSVSGCEVSGDTLSGSRPISAPETLYFQPADLKDFLAGTSVTTACEALALSRGTVHRLKQGYWPTDPRKIMAAWVAYKGRTVRRATSWFMRRVAAEGLRHGGKRYQAAQLAGRAGELLAVARAADGSLLAQSLDLPAERFVLARA